MPALGFEGGSAGRSYGLEEVRATGCMCYLYYIRPAFKPIIHSHFCNPPQLASKNREPPFSIGRVQVRNDGEEGGWQRHGWTQT